MKNKYYEKIDGLRFVAVTLVILEHYGTYLGAKIYAGFYGVNLFFVISGFLVTTSLLKADDKGFKSNYRHFVYRRALRIFPIYYFTIFTLYFISENARNYILSLATYTYNYVTAGRLVHVIGHFWSLCVEEQFYMLFPFIALPLRHKPKLLIIAICFIILLGYVQFMSAIFPSLAKYNSLDLLTSMSPLGLGVLAALIKPNEKFFNSRIVEYCVISVLILSLTVAYRFREVILGLCSFYFVIKAAFFKFSTLEKLLTNKKVIYIGTISYGIYIFHAPIGYYFVEYIFNPIWERINFSALGSFSIIKWHSWVIKLPVDFALSILVASFSYIYIERPFLQLKNKLR